MVSIPTSIPRRLKAFLAVANRADWAVSRERQNALWESLRAARSPRGWRGRWEGAFHALRGALATRVALMMMTVTVLALGGAHLLSRKGGENPWHRELRLAQGEEAVSVRGQPSGPGTITFSDGTNIGVGTAAKVIVESTTSSGAQVRLLAGQVDVRVRHRPHARWNFIAGPFRVEVKGTSFRLDWQPGADRMALTMWMGEVEVHRADRDESLTVMAGQSVVLTREGPLPAVTTERGGVEVGGDPNRARTFPDDRSASLGPPSGDAVFSRHRSTVGHDRRGHDFESSRTSWSALLAEGAFVDIVKHAERRGIRATLAHGNQADIAAFVDAARYTRRNELARRGLLTLVTRFPGSDRAQSAPFFLGRLFESTDVDAALAWYDRYLEQSPHGAYVEGAMARQMVLLRPHRAQRAQSIAQRYLDQYPDGTYRELAVRLIGLDLR